MDNLCLVHFNVSVPFHLLCEKISTYLMSATSGGGEYKSGRRTLSHFVYEIVETLSISQKRGGGVEMYVCVYMCMCVYNAGMKGYSSQSIGF